MGSGKMDGVGKTTKVVCVSHLDKKMSKETFDPPPLFRAVTTYFGYMVLYVVSIVGDFLSSVGLKTTGHVEVTKKDVCYMYMAVERAGLISLMFGRTGSR